MFDPSPEATLARKYEAAAERGFFRCLKELERMKKAAKAAEDDLFEEKLASFLPGEDDRRRVRRVGSQDDPSDRREADEAGQI